MSLCTTWNDILQPSSEYKIVSLAHTPCPYRPHQLIAIDRLQHSQTVGSVRYPKAEGVKLPNFGGSKPYPPQLPDHEEYLVEFDGHDDPLHAQNWPLKTKVLITAILIFDSLAATFASSIVSPAATYVQQEFNQGREAVTLATSLFVLGYAVGPSVFAPVSE